MLALGAKLVSQLGEGGGGDMLAVWMANYLAVKLQAATKAQSNDKAVLEGECVDLILRLWERRHSMPDRARPFQSFEVIFQALNELRSDQPRYSAFRNAGEVNDESAVGQLVKAALSTDQTASSIIRFFLAEAVARIPEGDKQWTELKAATKSSPADIRVVIQLMDDTVTLADKKAKLEQERIEEIRDILDSLLRFEAISATMRAALSQRIPDGGAEE